ncbi:MAG: FHA domain-containing protein [Gemmatimonadaceae bacterium]|nr:FHA domain-containing protein [Gemmatimonadaceae bacterium]
MTLLSLRDMRTGTVQEFASDELRLGRDPDCAVVIEGDGAGVVSGFHARLFQRDGRWMIEDLGSRNGTSLNGQRLGANAPQPIDVGALLRLGERGPEFRVDGLRNRRIAETIAEDGAAGPAGAPSAARSAPAVAPAAASAAASPASPTLELVLKEVRTGNRYPARGGRIRLGRGEECEVQPRQAGDSAVSRVHAEIVLAPDGRVLLRDLKSSNGTQLNAKPVTGDHELKLRDRIALGPGGPELLVEVLKLPPAVADAAQSPRPAAAGSAGARSAAHVANAAAAAPQGKTMMLRGMIEESSRKSASRLRVTVWSFVALMSASVAGFYWWTDQQQRLTARQLEEQRVALAAASEKTTALEGALQRAELALSQQLAAGDSAQRQSLDELNRLRDELAAASARVASGSEREARASRGLLDSLRSAIRSQEERSAAISDQVRAVKSVNLAAISQAAGPAVGMVTGYGGSEVWDGSGFVLTRSGYFVTNRHVATDNGKPADSLFVRLADTNQRLRAEVVSLPTGDTPDLALLRIRDYGGPVIPKIDWSGTRAKQGESAAMIGYPAGASLAYDFSTGAVRTSMSAGIFAQVTSDELRFNGFSVGGSSGSPLFNADGEVVGVHRAGLREALAQGQRQYGFAVPVRQLIPLLPADARAELGIR